ncbi:MAG: prolipoprotein diacylglyceryl transferase [Nanoarchaeota archaeon]|nr:prolipoprotein diacylglyceryl transferase [Nanoarchaeota archaeon]
MVLPYIFYPEINLGFIKIYSFGLLTAIAFLTALWLNLKEGKRRGINKEIIQGMMFYIILFSIIGARIMHIITEWQLYSDNILSVFMIWNGGLSFYGGFLGGVIAAYVFLKSKKLSFLKYMDLISPAIALGHAIGRIGCVIGDGGHLGKITNLPWGIWFEGAARHPTALYGFFNLMILFIILMYLRKKKFFRGFLFSFYIAYYAFTRFFIDLLRIDPTHYGLTSTQWIAIPLFLITAGFIFKKWKW